MDGTKTAEQLHGEKVLAVQKLLDEAFALTEKNGFPDGEQSLCGSDSTALSLTIRSYNTFAANMNRLEIRSQHDGKYWKIHYNPTTKKVIDSTAFDDKGFYRSGEIGFESSIFRCIDAAETGLLLLRQATVWKIIKTI